MLAVEASTTPGVFETEIPGVFLKNETLRNLLGGKKNSIGTYLWQRRHWRRSDHILPHYGI